MAQQLPFEFEWAAKGEWFNWHGYVVKHYMTSVYGDSYSVTYKGRLVAEGIESKELAMLFAELRHQEVTP